MPAATFTRADMKALPKIRLFAVKTTLDPANIAAAAETTNNVTVTGVKLGDAIMGFSHDATPPTDHQSIIWHVYVSAADTVTISLTNTHAANAVNWPTGTFRALVARF